jgi:hypothetical protein
MKLATASRSPTQGERIVALEKRADAHDAIAAQVGEMYEFFKTLRTINWFVVKVGAWLAGGLGLIAVVLTIATNAAKLLGH